MAAAFVAVDEASERGDAQRLAEAFGIDYAALTQLAHAQTTDMREARAMNQALWPATLGYYLEQMLGVGAATVRGSSASSWTMSPDAARFLRSVSARSPTASC